MRNSGASANISTVSISILLLILLTADYAQSQKQGGSTLGGNALQEQIVAQERVGLDTLKTGDLTTFGATTAEDAIFVDAHGPATKTEVVEHTAAFRLRDYTMSDVRFLPLSADSGLVIYTLVESGTSHGKDFTARVYVSSLWLKRDGKWQCKFSQETGAR